MIKCPECGYEEWETWWICPRCGYKVGDKPMKEILILEVNDEGDPYLHAGRFESYFYDDAFQHNLMTVQPWPGLRKAKVKITIEEIKE